MRLGGCMTQMTYLRDIASELEKRQPLGLDVSTAQPVSGGSIHSCYRIQSDRVEFFLKVGLSKPGSKSKSKSKSGIGIETGSEMFRAEASSLKAIARAEKIRTPAVIELGETKDHAFLLLEFISLSRGSEESFYQLGIQLAQLHRHTAAANDLHGNTTGVDGKSLFGFAENNFIGLTPQINDPKEQWVDFFWENRLKYQVDLIQNRLGKHWAFRNLAQEKCITLLSDYQPEASLVHGDLWSGNASFDENGTPVIFDPACYYGDREVDIAMTELFGGFRSSFYEGYANTWPLHEGYSKRKTLYNLYHLLNHYNLFGGSYLSQAEGMLKNL